jgi:2'-5' RNA ligase
MRLFTGLDLPEPVQERLDLLISHLRSRAHIKWSPAYNLHITTKFIGEWPTERLEDLKAALGAIQCAPLDIAVRTLGWFPNAQKPRVFWAGVESSTLAVLAKATDEGCSRLGIAPEDRPFSPHLTLARIKEPVPLQPLRDAVAEIENVEFGHFSPSHFYLYRSQPGASGSIYSKLQEFPLPPA